MHRTTAFINFHILRINEELIMSTLFLVFFLFVSIAFLEAFMLQVLLGVDYKKHSLFYKKLFRRFYKLDED